MNLNKSIYIYLLTGILVGFFNTLLVHFNIQSSFFYIWLSLFGMMYLLAAKHTTAPLELILTSIVGAVIASIPIYAWQSGENQTPHHFVTPLIALLNAYAINAFHISYHINKQWLAYSALFSAVWDTLIDLLIALLFTAIVWIFFILCNSLFAILHIDIDFILDSHWFYITTTSILFAAGLYIAASAKTITLSSRQILLLLCKYLLPVLSIIGLLFLIAWAITFQTLSEIKTPGQSVFVTIAFLSILFFNGVYQDGNIKKPYPTIFHWITSVFIIATPIFSILAFAFYIRSDHTGFAHVTTLANYGLLILYNLVYATITAYFQKPWVRIIQKANISLAIIFIFIVLITNNPWFNAFL